MADGRRTRWVAHDVYFLDDDLGATMFDRFGAAGVALWHGFIAACKKNHNEGETTFSSDAEALVIFGLPGMPLVNSDGEPFDLADWLQLLSDHKVIRRTSRGRRTKVVCSKWEAWQKAARRSRKAQTQAEARDAEAEQNRRSEADNTGTVTARNGHGPSAKQAQMTDTDTDTEETLATAKPTRKKDPIFEALIEACGWDLNALTDSARGRTNKAAKELRQIGATPEGIHARAGVHRSKWPDMSLTPNSLAANYAELGKTNGHKTIHHDVCSDCGQALGEKHNQETCDAFKSGLIRGY